jgi:tetratricopeptide (TPR) repeat protein
MKKRTTLFVFYILLSATLTFGQGYTFKVLINKGMNEIKTGGNWQAIKTGAILNPGDELKIAENAQVTLVYKTGDAMEEKKAGTYKIEELEKRMKSTPSVLNKYTDFMLSSNSAEAKKNRLSATGAVHRGLEDIKVFLPENQNSEIFNSTVYVNWEASAKGPYIVTLTNMFDEELAKIETPEASVKVDLNDPKLSSETAILITVKVKSDSKKKSEAYLIKKLSSGRYETIKKSYTELNNELSPDYVELNKLIQASFYEQNKLFIDAISCYEELMKLDPANESYREIYDEFLYRNKLKNPK